VHNGYKRASASLGFHNRMAVADRQDLQWDVIDGELRQAAVTKVAAVNFQDDARCTVQLNCQSANRTIETIKPEYSSSIESSEHASHGMETYAVDFKTRVQRRFRLGQTKS
jgi:hypothetical protein